MPVKCRTICVVDDDPAVCKALSRLIRLSGFVVKSYGSAQALLAGKQLGSIDLLLLDIKMPAMDGFAIQDRLSASGFNIPIVFMTAHEADRMRAKAMAAGAVDFLQKPIEEQDLLEAITKGLK